MQFERKRLIFAIAGSLLLTGAVMLPLMATFAPEHVKAALGADPNADFEGFRHLRSKKFTREQRAQLNKARRGDAEEITGESSFSIEDLPDYKYPGDVEVVKEQSDITLPSRCTKLKGARAIRCAAVYLKNGLVYDANRRSRDAIGTFVSKAPTERVNVRVTLERPGARLHSAAPTNDRYIPILEGEPLIPPSDLLFQTLTVKPTHTAAPSAPPLRPTVSVNDSTTSEE